MSNSLDYHKSQLKQRAKPETSVVIRQLDTSDSFLELLLRTIANTDQNDSFEGVRYIESLLQMLNSSLKSIRADFSSLTLFYSSYAPREAVTSGFIVRMARLCSVLMLPSQPLCCIRLGTWGGRLNSLLQLDSPRRRRTM